MKYIKGKIYTTDVGAERVELLLEMKGISQFSVEGPTVRKDIIENKDKLLWDFLPDEIENEETIVTFYLDENMESLARELQVELLGIRSRNDYNKVNPVDLGRLYMETWTVDDSEWKDKWKEFFVAAKVTETIVVKPTWQNLEEESLEGEFKNCKVIEMDPGMAFGTGTHETTSMCMKLVEKYDCENKIVLDVGTGTGILAIGAAKLGAKEALGVDIDKDAVEVAKENIILNNEEKKASAIYGDLTKGLDMKADIVVANLVSNLVIYLADDVKNHMNDKGIFIASGILEEQKEGVRKELKIKGLNLIDSMVEGIWCALVFEA